MNIVSIDNINNQFVELLKKKITQYNVTVDKFRIQLIEFSNNNVDEPSFKLVLKCMLNRPYYENMILVDNLRKFKIILEIVEKMCNEDLENALSRLDKIKVPNNTFTPLNIKKYNLCK